LPKHKPGNAAHGKELFETRGCLACHSIGEGDEFQGGTFAANLTRVGEKDNYDYLVRWVHNARERTRPYCPYEKKDIGPEDYKKKGLPYVFDLERSARGLRLNRFLHGFTILEKREFFRENPEKAMAQANLGDEEKKMIVDASKIRSEAQAKKQMSVQHWINDLPWEQANIRLESQPTANIEGLVGGYTGPGGKTVLPHKAVAKMDFRLVPDMKAADVVPAIKAHLAKRGFGDIEVNMSGGYDPTQTAASAPTHPARLVHEVGRALPRDGRVYIDIGDVTQYAEAYMKICTPGAWQISPGMAEMGWASSGIPGALVADGRPGIALVGDGAFNMTSQVVASAVEYDLPAIWVILNNYELGIERKGMERSYQRSHPWCRFVRKDNGKPYNPDYVALAHAYGAEGVRIEDPADLAGALAKAFATRRPWVIDVPIDLSVGSYFTKGIDRAYPDKWAKSYPSYNLLRNAEN